MVYFSLLGRHRAGANVSGALDGLLVCNVAFLVVTVVMVSEGKGT